MSLINQMLRDLEQRNPPKPVTTTRQPLRIQNPVYQPQMPRKMHWWLPTMALVLMTFFWFQDTHQNPIPAPAAPTHAPIQTQPLNIPAVESEPPAAASSTQSTAPEIIAAASPEQPAAAMPQGLIPSNQNQPISQSAPASAIKSTPAINSKIAKTPTNAETPAKPANAHTLRGTSQQAETLYHQAEASASRMMRKEVLREALQFNPRHLAARHLLLQTLMQEKPGIELKQFLDESLTLFPGNPGFITALAHWQIKQKNFSTAIKTLEQIDSDAKRDPQYLALLAASYQQQQSFTQALPLYQKLSQIQPDKAENWLGMAICADKLQQINSAIQAYQQALSKKTLQDDVVDYIKQRLSALTR